MEQRKVGRPPKGLAEVGKAGLIRSARKELRAKRYDVFQRKDLASACGVTPALITYYFKDSEEIFCSIISEVVERYYNDLRSIVRSDAGQAFKYRTAVNLLIDAFRRDGNIFDIFEHAIATKRCNSPDFIALAKEELRELCRDCFRVGLPDAFDRSVFYGAVWGMCEAAAKYTPTLSDPAPLTAAVVQLHELANAEVVSLEPRGGMPAVVRHDAISPSGRPR